MGKELAFKTQQKRYANITSWTTCFAIAIACSLDFPAFNAASLALWYADDLRDTRLLLSAAGSLACPLASLVSFGFSNFLALRLLVEPPKNQMPVHLVSADSCWA